MTPSAIAFLAGTGILIPILAYASKKQLDRGLVVPRLPFYVEAIALQIVLLAGAFYVASRNRMILFRAPELDGRSAALGSLLLATALAAMILGWRFAGPETRDRLRLLIPTTTLERLVWAGVSLSASFSEEVAYRGVLVTLLNRSFRNWWWAVLISSILFALAHLMQGWRSAAIVGVFGFLFHLLVAATGGLYVAIVVHFAYDLVAGWTLSALLPREQRTVHEPAV